MAVKKSEIKNPKVNKKAIVASSRTSRSSAKVSKTQTEENGFKIPFYNTERFMKLSEKIVNFRPNKIHYILLVVAGLILLLASKKELIIAAMVNGQPISNIELQLRLNQQFRAQVLDQMITEKIILDEAAKNNAIPTDADIDKKIAEIETQVGGAQALDSLLTGQGQTRASVKKQLQLPLALDNLYAKEATVSADEIEKFLEANKDFLKASDSASQAKEAENTLRQQKISQISAKKFQELKLKANVKIF